MEQEREPVTQKPVLSGLRVRNPTPSTIEYTVTTRPERWSRRFITALVLKVIVLGIILGFILLKQDYCDNGLQDGLRNSILNLKPDINPKYLDLLRGKVHWYYLALLGFSGVWIASLRGYTEESLLVLRGLGVQVTTSPSSYFVKANTRFIPTSTIQDIFIHEGFVGFEVRFYLAIVIRDESEVVVVFPKLLPRREILENVWRGSRSLYEPEAKAQ
ncbi:hypothetical protein TWF970_003460 [Orbilia oligospora]|uniref:Phosphatidylinositol N-acetylglucosaminyltransferase subunit H conserved domain-containing protein n=1 Tax=Orbilia oligospora TaxID=2813651 RepID=A0A7C8RJ59_ORBOL|nr:hypothetical protein TWF970_003460 [Orbilia oligospora]